METTDIFPRSILRAPDNAGMWCNLQSLNCCFCWLKFKKKKGKKSERSYVKVHYMRDDQNVYDSWHECSLFCFLFPLLSSFFWLYIYTDIRKIYTRTSDESVIYIHWLLNRNSWCRSAGGTPYSWHILRLVDRGFEETRRRTVSVYTVADVTKGHRNNSPDKHQEKKKGIELCIEKNAKL